MKDGLFRRAAKRIAALCYRGDLAAARFLWHAQGTRPFELRGCCRVCGECCVNPSIQVGRVMWHLPVARGLFLFWHKHINGFELVSRDGTTRMFTFRCTHYDPDTRRCDSYESRPGMCRDYPCLLLWQPRPEFLPGCGYRPVAPNSRSFIEALEREGLSPDKLELVKKKLFLEDDRGKDA